MRNRGQSTVELLISVSVLMITVTGVGWVFKAEWDHGKCIYFVFEKTHAALIGTKIPSSNIWMDSPIDVQNLPEGAKGIAFCGGSPETVSLPQLEPNTPSTIPSTTKIGSL
jgi:hypothetical protein